MDDFEDEQRPARGRRSVLRRLLAAVIVVAWIATLAVLVRGGGTATVTTASPEQPGACARCLPETRELYPQVAFIGDSWTLGSDMGGRGAKNWSALLCKAKQWRLEAVSAVGGTGYLEGADWTPRPQHFGAPDRIAVLDDKIDLVFIANGVNDGKQPMEGVEAAAFEAYTAVRAAAPRARIVVVGYIPVVEEDGEVAARNEALASAARRARVTFWNPVGKGWFTGGNARYLGVDRFHPTDEGERHFTRLLAEQATAAGLDEIEHPEKPAPPAVLGT